MGRPIQFPRQLVIQVSDPTDERVRQDAAARDDRSVSGATRRFIELGIILADVIDDPGLETGDLDIERARAVK